MNDRSPDVETAKLAMTARVIHGAISAGIVIVFAAFLFLRSEASAEGISETGRVLRIVGYIALAGGVLISGLLRGRIPPRRRGTDVGAWWSQSLPKALVVWAAAEGGGLAAMVMGWMIGDTTLLALGAALPLAVLFASRPGRLAGQT